MKLWYKCDSNDMNSYNKYQTNIFKNKAEYTTKYCIALQLFINEPKEDRYTWRGNIWDNPFFFSTGETQFIQQAIKQNKVFKAVTN